MKNKIAIVSVSGGKDSTATAILAIDRYGKDGCQFVFADTGHEHPLTIEYLFGQFQDDLGVEVRTVRADLSADIERKRQYVEKYWPEKLMTGRVGKWVLISEDEGNSNTKPQEPIDPYKSAKYPGWEWFPTVKALSPEASEARVKSALSALRPTGIPFLDLCLVKGRFPSSRAQFCTAELKRRPIDSYMLSLIAEGKVPESWQGIRRDESRNRANALNRERSAEGWWIERPIIDWTAQQVVDFVRLRGVRLNPLYRLGSGRVGCWPCINIQKNELLNNSKRWPDRIDIINEWERIVGDASLRGYSTFLYHKDAAGLPPEAAYSACNIKKMIEWARTSRGGNQFDLFRDSEPEICSSMYGMCE